MQALLGEIAEKQGRFLDAAQHFQDAAKLDPSEANLYLLSMEYLKHWTFEPALKFFEYGVAQYPSSQRMLLGLGITRYSMNQVLASMRTCSLSGALIVRLPACSCGNARAPGRGTF